MTTRRLTTRRHKLEKQRTEILDMLTAGKTQAEVARVTKVSREAVSKFVERHLEELTARTEAIEAEAANFAISNKVWRIGEYQSLYSTAKAEIDVAEDTYGKVAAVKAASSALKAVAEELGQLPKADITLNVQNNVVNLSWGEPVEPPVVIEQLPSADNNP